MSQLSPRQKAKSAGLTRYNNGKPCKHGHISDKYTSSGNCVICAAAKRDDWETRNKEYHKQTSREWKERNRERNLQKMREWHARHPHYNSNYEKYRRQNARLNQSAAGAKRRGNEESST